MTIGIEVAYNDDLEQLQRALTGVRRPGGFFVQGAFDAPMPRIVVRGAARAGHRGIKAARAQYDAWRAIVEKARRREEGSPEGKHSQGQPGCIQHQG